MARPYNEQCRDYQNATSTLYVSGQFTRVSSEQMRPFAPGFPIVVAMDVLWLWTKSDLCGVLPTVEPPNTRSPVAEEG